MRARAVAAAFLLIGVFRGGSASGSILPRYGSAISILLDGPVETLDPARARSLSERDLVSLLFETLVRRGPDGRIEPAAAERWDISTDGRVIVFYLRSGLQFSDGTAVKAASFVESWRRLSAQAPEWSWIFSSARFEAVGDLQVRLTLERPDPDFPSYLSLPATAAVRVVPGEGAPSLLGSGPFRFAGIRDGAFLLAPRADHYEGRPFPSRLLFRVAGPNAGAGPFDFADAPATAAGTTLNRPTATQWLLVLNARRPSLAAAERRQAVSRALDRKAMAPPGAEPLTRLLDDEPGIGNDGPAATPGTSSPVTLLTDAGDAVSRAAADRLRENLVPSGFTVSVRSLSSSAFGAALRAGDFDAALIRWEPPDVRAGARELVMRPEIAAAFGPDSPRSPDPIARALEARNHEIVLPLFRRTGRLSVRGDVAGVHGGTYSGRRLADAFTVPWSGP